MSEFKVKSTNISSVVSISLVLLMLGLVGLIIINAQQLSKGFKESRDFPIFIKSGVKDMEVQKFKKELSAKEYVISAQYKAKEEAAEELLNDFKKTGASDTNFLSLLDGEIPLPNQIVIQLNEAYFQPDSLRKIEAQIEKNPIVREFVYPSDTIFKIYQNASTIAYYLLGVCAVFLFIALALIHSTIRLAVYSKRFIIRTMQLIGAKSWFILKPFISVSILQGIFSGILAVLGVIGAIHLLEQNIRGYQDVENKELQLILFAGILVLGLVISILSTYITVRRYLRKDLDKLTLD